MIRTGWYRGKDRLNGLEERFKKWPNGFLTAVQTQFSGERIIFLMGEAQKTGRPYVKN